MGNCKVLDDLTTENDELKKLLADTQHQLHKTRKMNQGHIDNAALIGRDWKELKDENEALKMEVDALKAAVIRSNEENTRLTEENATLKQTARLDGISVEAIDKLYNALGAVKNTPQVVEGDEK